MDSLGGGRDSSFPSGSHRASRLGMSIPGFYVHSRIFDWNPSSLNADTISTPAGAAENLKVSVPERAVLELLSEVGTR